jgi:hypothetical protein
MPGKEALDHIRETDGCSASDAIKQLQSAISDGHANARLPDPKEPRRSAIFPPWDDKSIYYNAGLPTPMLSAGLRKIPTREEWGNAKILTNGTVRFFGRVTARYAFEVRRSDILRIWLTSLASPSASSARKRKRPIEDGIKEAITALWENNIPQGLRPKERDNKIAEWLKSKNYSVPSGLARAVQRAIKPRV